jgi:hypothetical protein
MNLWLHLTVRCDDVLERVDRVLDHLFPRRPAVPRPNDQIQAELGQLRADVERQTSFEQSVTVLFDGLGQQLDKIGSSAVDVQDARNQLSQLRAQLGAERESIARALTANATPTPANTTPASPPVTPTPAVVRTSPPAGLPEGGLVPPASSAGVTGNPASEEPGANPRKR